MCANFEINEISNRFNFLAFEIILSLSGSILFCLENSIDFENLNKMAQWFVQKLEKHTRVQFSESVDFFQISQNQTRYPKSNEQDITELFPKIMVPI